MYLRPDHAEHDLPTLRQFIRDNALGELITAIPSLNFPTIQCTHIPWLLDIEDPSSDTELGTLRAHLAKMNPHAKALSEAVQITTSSNGPLSEEVLVLFNGPADHYVTPKFYVETKPSTGKVVPTWNYTAVQAYGKATVFFDSKAAETGEFLQKQISDLSLFAETAVMGYTGGDRMKAWGVDDAPDRYIELLKKNIIGIEIKLTRLQGKFKMSQEMGKGDREGVAKGFESLKTEVAAEMARTVKERSVMKEMKVGA